MCHGYFFEVTGTEKKNFVIYVRSGDLIHQKHLILA